MNERPKIVVTLGDPAGIGPEIALRALGLIAARKAPPKMLPILIGTRSTFAAAKSLINSPIDAVDAVADVQWPQVNFVALSDEAADILPGEVSRTAGKIAYDSIVTAARLALDGEADAIVTAPVNKAAINLSGHAFVGHTELLAELLGAKTSCMMLANSRLVVSHVCTHVALAEVPSRLTAQRLSHVIDLTSEALTDLGMEKGRIAVCGLNPHCGEGGLFGQEDGEVIAPVVEEYICKGLRIVGPVAADTVFLRAMAGEFDAVVAMYHDQGHVPFKMAAFAASGEAVGWSAVGGVNITLGLPTIRTSVDHGTAFDIAGKGKARAESMMDAIDFAVRLAVNRYRAEFR